MIERLVPIQTWKHNRSVNIWETNAVTWGDRSVSYSADHSAEPKDTPRRSALSLWGKTSARKSPPGCWVTCLDNPRTVFIPLLSAYTARAGDSHRGHETYQLCLPQINTQRWQISCTKDAFPKTNTSIRPIKVSNFHKILTMSSLHWRGWFFLSCKSH